MTWEVLEPLEQVRRDLERRLTALRECDKAIESITRSPIDVYQHVLRAVTEGVSATYGQILVRTGKGDRLKIVASIPEKAIGNEFDINNCVSGLAILRRGPVYCADLRDDEECRAVYKAVLGDETKPMRSELAVPVLVDDMAIGVLNLESPEAHAFDRDVDVVGLFAARAATLFRDAEHAEDVRVVDDVYSALWHGAKSTELEDLVRRLADGVARLWGADVRWQILVTEPGDGLRIIYSSSGADIGARVPIDDCVSGKAVQKKAPEYIRDVSQERAYKRMLGSDIKSELALPVYRSGEVVGVLNLESAQELGFDEYTAYRLEGAARQLGFALLGLKVRTDLERSEALNRADSILVAIGDQTSNLIHRLNNVVGSIRVWADELLASSPQVRADAFLVKTITQIRDNALAALEVPRKMQEQIVGDAPVNVNQVLEELVRTMPIPSSVKPDIRHLSEKPLPAVRLSSLYLVFRNLIQNSLDHMPAGGALTLTTDLIEFAGVKDRWISVKVQDTGHGIPPEELSQVFDPEYSRRKSRAGRGLGFGLWWVKTFLDRVQGDISVTSKVGEGTTVEVRLPVTAETSGHNAEVS